MSKSRPNNPDGRPDDYSLIPQFKRKDLNIQEEPESFTARPRVNKPPWPKLPGGLNLKHEMRIKGYQACEKCHQMEQAPTERKKFGGNAPAGRRKFKKQKQNPLSLISLE